VVRLKQYFEHRLPHTTWTNIGNLVTAWFLLPV